MGTGLNVAFRVGAAGSGHGGGADVAICGLAIMHARGAMEIEEYGSDEESRKGGGRM